MRIILDTNVLISALISQHSWPNAIYRAWRAARFDLVTSEAQIDELKRVSRYPKLKTILPPHRIGAVVNNLQHAIVLDALSALPEEVGTNDPNDAFLLAMALTSKADYLVTGDCRAGLLHLKNIGRTRIVTPAVFCAVSL